MAIRLQGAPGITLAADVFGDETAPPVVLLHGGGQTRHAWSGAGQRLGAAGFRAWSLDLRGHGESDWAGVGGYSIDAFAADLRPIVRRIVEESGRAPALVGASLGGLTSLVIAGEAPAEPCPALVLVDVAPRMEKAGQARISAFMRQKPEGFASLDEVADAVASYLPHRPRPKDPQGLSKNVRVGQDGRYYWHWDPAFMSSNGLGKDTSNPERFEAAAKNLTLPVLLVRGGISDVVSHATVDAFLAVLPNAEVADVAGAGHMVAGDRNDAFADAAIGFLTRHVPR